jgi:hypothetical protein
MLLQQPHSQQVEKIFLPKRFCRLPKTGFQLNFGHFLALGPEVPIG